MDFKDRLHELRKATGLSLTKFASQFDKSEGAVRMWENGRSKPDADTLVKLAEYFDCTTDYLLGISDYLNDEEQSAVEDTNDEVQGLLQGLPVAERFQIMDMFMHIIDSIKAYAVDSDERKELMNLLGHLLKLINRSTTSPSILSLVLTTEDDEKKRATAHYAISELSNYQLSCNRAIDNMFNLFKQDFIPYYNIEDEERFSKRIAAFHKSINDSFANPEKMKTDTCLPVSGTEDIDATESDPQC